MLLNVVQSAVEGVVAPIKICPINLQKIYIYYLIKSYNERQLDYLF